MSAVIKLVKVIVYYKPLLFNTCYCLIPTRQINTHFSKLYRRQKRWWNAYLLFYERVDVLAQPDRASSANNLVMPVDIERSVRKENIQYMHVKTQFSEEYFQFMRKLTSASVVSPPQQQMNKVCTKFNLLILGWLVHLVLARIK